MSMIAEPILLPPDVVITPVEELPPEILEGFEHRPGDHALTRPMTRVPSTVVDAQSARLLERFRSPTRIVDAVIGFSTELGLDPGQTLERSFPVLQRFLNNGMLLAADSEAAQPIGAALPPAARIGDFRVIRAVHVMIDTEVYLARRDDGTHAAVKMSRPGTADEMRPLFAHEAVVLDRLGGRRAPRVLATGEHEGRPYLALEWLAGTDIETAATEARQRIAADGGAALLALGASVLEAYADVHARGVLHGDVHPRNALIDADGGAVLVDFGFSEILGQHTPPWRGGIDFFMEPEAAIASLEGRPPTSASPLAEQYSVGALLYLLLTGSHTHNFSLEPRAMLAQLAEAPIASFDEVGAGPWPRVEATLQQALAKDPVERHPDMVALVAAYRTAVEDDLADRAPSPTAVLPSATDALLDAVLERASADGPLLGGTLEAPTASVWLGAAGIGVAVLRIARARDDHRLLALADLWASRAVADLARDDALWNDALEITPDAYGETSILHSAAGVHMVAAMVAIARGDPVALSVAIDAFLAAAGGRRDQLDTAFGRAGLLTGCAALLEAIGSGSDEDLAGLRALGAGLDASIDRELAGMGPIERSPLTVLGAAHGWAGILTARLRWAQALGVAPPIAVRERLDELATVATPLGRGVFWPRDLTAPDDLAMAGSWCNGAAGFVQLWAAAARSYGAAYVPLVEAAAWTAYETPPATGDLCCGMAGRAYALLAARRATGDDAWLDRARDLATASVDRIGEHALRRDSLYKGEFGVAVLLAEIEHPDDAGLPLFESERWTV